jgi:phosphonate transport system ATP-binding protein
VVSETGTTLVFTTHNVDHARRYSGRVLGLKDGRLTLDAMAARLDLGTLNDLYG